MNINQLIETVEKKILSQDCISKVYIEDKSFLHKNHKSNENGKFHIVLSIESDELKNKSWNFLYKFNRSFSSKIPSLVAFSRNLT